MKFWHSILLRAFTALLGWRPPGRNVTAALFFSATTALSFSAAASTPSLEERAAALYRPFQAERVTLAPDGKHLAYTRNESGQLLVVIVDVDNPTLRTSVKLSEDRTLKFSKEKDPARLRYLRWITPKRLVMVLTEEVFELPVAGEPGELPKESGWKFVSPIWAIDADGSNSKKLADGSDFAMSINLVPPPPPGLPPDVTIARHINAVGRLAGDSDHILIEALGMPALSREMSPIPTSLFKVNIHTGKSTVVTEEIGEGRHLYDWQGRARILYQQPQNLLTREFAHQPPKGGRWRAPGSANTGSLPKDFTLSPDNYFGTRAFPLAFDFDAKVLYFASNAGRDTFAIYGLDTTTGQRTSLAIEHPHFDLAPLEPPFPGSPLVFDETHQQLVGVRATGVTPFTAWVDPELAEVQRALDRKFPRRVVEVLEWDDDRRRFLLRVSGGSDVGRHFVYRRAENVLVEFLRRAPWLRSGDLHETTPFEFDTPEGVHLTGYLTHPRTPRLNPPPLVICFPAGFPAQAQPDFDADAQMLASLGFLVMRVNHRGVVGFGARHRDAIQQGIDRVPIDDALATAEWVAKRYKFDRRRIAAMGEGFGGYLALRALQLHPSTFRCAISLNAPMDLEVWLQRAAQDDATLDKNFSERGGAGVGEIGFLGSEPRKFDFTREAHHAFFRRNSTSLADASVLRAVAALTKPVFLIVTSQRPAEIGSGNSQLRSKLRSLGRAPDYLEVQQDYVLRLPAARAKAFRRIEEFFNLNLYDYKVDVGEMKAIK